MSDKQREDHVQAKYWNGFLTRVEAQKVFDETAQVVNAQAQAMQKFDAIISCIAEKIGLTPADVNEWITKQIKQSQSKEKVQAPQVPYECICKSENGEHNLPCTSWNKNERNASANSNPINTEVHGKPADHEPKRIIEA